MTKIEKYFSKHVEFNASVHAIGGIGVGVVLTHVLFDPHPVRWGIVLIAIALLGHFYAYKMQKGK